LAKPFCLRIFATTLSVEAAAVALDEAVWPFCRGTNGLLSVPKCIRMLLGPEAANPPVGPEPRTGVSFVQPADGPVRHLGSLLMALCATWAAC
jgi:hypothetical protein